MIWIVIVLLALAGVLNGVQLHRRDQVNRVRALCDRWDALSKGETSTTRQIRRALRG